METNPQETPRDGPPLLVLLERVHPEHRAEGCSAATSRRRRSINTVNRGTATWQRSASHRRGFRFPGAYDRRWLAAIRRCASSALVGSSVCVPCTVARTHPDGRLRARSRAHPLARLDERQQQLVGGRGDAVALAGRDDPPRDGVDLRSACVDAGVRASTVSVTVASRHRRRVRHAYLDPRRRSDSMEQMLAPVLLATRSTSSSSSWARSERVVSL